MCFHRFYFLNLFLLQIEGNDEEIYSFDHVYPGSENNTITVVLYSEIGTKEFKEFHEYIKKAVASDSGKIKYVSRHFIRVRILI